MKRTRLKVYTPIKRRTPLRYRSRVPKGPPPLHPNRALRLRGQDKRDLRAAAFDRSGGYCEGRTKGGSRCITRIFWNTFHLDHEPRRSRGGMDILEHVVCLCPKCHVGYPDSKHPGPQWSGILYPRQSA